MLYFFAFLATQYKHHSLLFCECGLDGFVVGGSSTSKMERRIRGWREDVLKISKRCCGSDFSIPVADRLVYRGWQRNFSDD